MTTKEAYSVLESANFLRDLGEVQPMTPEDMETRRRIIEILSCGNCALIVAVDLT
jgi:hypothetical protein